MRKAVLWSLAGILAVASGATRGGARSSRPRTRRRSTRSASLVSQSLGAFNLTPAELELVKAGLTDGVAQEGQEGRPAGVRAEDPGDADRARAAPSAAAEKKAGQAFLEKAAAEKGATKTPSRAS